MSVAPTVFSQGTHAGGPLAELARVSFDAVERGEKAQVVFDLDDTLFLVRPRKRVIFRELAEAHAHDAPLAEALHRLSQSEIPYDVKEALATVGVEHHETVERLKGMFFARFFDGDYTRHDAPNEGAAAYVRHLYARGVHVVYLTGRPEEMQDRTLDTLADHGFPVDEQRARLMLKGRHESHVADADFKGFKAVEIAAHGPVLGVFDNEPANLNAMLPFMPQARYFLLDTDRTPDAPEPVMSAHTLVDFTLARKQLAASLAASPEFKSSTSWTISVQQG